MAERDNQPWTVRRILAWIAADLSKREIESPRLEADLLVSHALSQKRLSLYLDLDRPLIESELARIRQLVARRRAFEPIAYIVGEREFYGRSFEVNRDVLIPRPDTETLVEQALKRLGTLGGDARLLALCTGSGAVALSLLAELPTLRALATDISRPALDTAARNAQRLGVSERLELCCGDLFAALPGDERFGVITVNPPYIAAHELPELSVDVREYEPHLALIPGADGLLFYRRLAREAARYLVEGGVLLVEVGYTQAAEVMALFRAAQLTDVSAHKDLGGTERVVVGRKLG